MADSWQLIYINITKTYSKTTTLFLLGRSQVDSISNHNSIFVAKKFSNAFCSWGAFSTNTWKYKRKKDELLEKLSPKLSQTLSPKLFPKLSQTLSPKLFPKLSSICYWNCPWNCLRNHSNIVSEIVPKIITEIDHKIVHRLCSPKLSLKLFQKLSQKLSQKFSQNLFRKLSPKLSQKFRCRKIQQRILFLRGIQYEYLKTFLKERWFSTLSRYEKV